MYIKALLITILTIACSTSALAGKANMGVLKSEVNFMYVFHNNTQHDFVARFEGFQTSELRIGKTIGNENPPLSTKYFENITEPQQAKMSVYQGNELVCTIEVTVKLLLGTDRYVVDTDFRDHIINTNPAECHLSVNYQHYWVMGTVTLKEKAK